MEANLINAGAILVGSLLGLIFKKLITKKISDYLIKVIGLCICIIGITLAVKIEQVLLLIICCVIGTLVGTVCRLDELLERFGIYIKNKFIKNDDGGYNFTEGFVASSMIFCIGSMAIVGPLQAGLQGNNTILLSKALIDGITSISLAASLGLGVMFSAFPVFVYQGIIFILAAVAAPLLGTEVIAAMSAVGGVLLLGIGLMMAGVKDLKITPMVPAVFLPILLVPLFALF